MQDIGKKLNMIREVLGSTVIFKIGMKEPGKYDILSIDTYNSDEDEMKEIDYLGYIG